MIAIKKGDRVRSIANNFTTYRVLSIGPKRARLAALNTGAWFSCYCAVGLLRKLRQDCRAWPRCSCIMRGNKRADCTQQ